MYYRTCCCLLLLLSLCLKTGLFSDEEEEKQVRFRFRLPEKTLVFEGTPPSSTEGNYELSEAEWKQNRDRAKKYWESRKGQPIDKQTVVKLYEAAVDFRVLHSLLGEVIDASESRQIGGLRQQIHEEVIGNLANRKEFGNRLGINDFGSGTDPSKVDAKTDIDFTGYSEDVGIAGEEIVRLYREEFRRVTQKYGAGIDPGQMDIVAHRYEATIPDWRQNMAIADFEVRLRTGLDLLKKNPEAYFLEGAYLQQVMKRSADPHSKTFTWYAYDDNGNLVKNSLNATQASAYFYHPDIAKRYAWGASVGNWHFYHAHSDDLAAQAKYLLRSTDDGAGVTIGKAKKGAFEKLNDWQRRMVINRLYGGRISQEKIRGMLAALNTSVNIRALKDKKTLNLSSEEGRMAAYEPLIEYERQKLGEIRMDDADLLRMAEQSFKNFGNQLLIENNILTSKERLTDWLSPPKETSKPLFYMDEDGNPKRVVIDPDMQKRLQYAAFFELRDGISLLDDGQIQRIKKENPKFAREIEILKGIVDKQKTLLVGQEGLTTKETQSKRQQALDMLKEDYRQLRAHIGEKGVGRGLLAAGRQLIAHGDQVENWVHERIQDAVVSKVGGKKYLPSLQQLRREVELKNQQYLGTDWMLRFSAATSFIEVAKAYVREGEFNQNVIDVAFREGFSYLPFVGTYYSVQSGASGVGTLILVRVIPGYGQIVLTGHLVKGVVELGGLMIFEPLKRDKVLLAYQGYLEPEEGGWIFSSGQSERVESPRPSLLYPVDPDKRLDLNVRRERMYQFFNDRITAIMKNDPSIWFTEEEIPFDWQKKEFELLRPHVQAYVDDWWNGAEIFSELDVLTVHRGADIRPELVERLVRDYVTGKNISIQKSMKENEEAIAETLRRLPGVVGESLAFDDEAALLRGDYQLAGEAAFASLFEEMPEVAPSMEITLAPRVDESDEEGLSIESLGLRAKVNASMKTYPAPWKIEWQIKPRDGEILTLEPGSREESQGKRGKVIVVARASDKDGKPIVSKEIELDVERYRVGKDEADEDSDTGSQDMIDKEEDKITDKMDDLIQTIGAAGDEGMVICGEGSEQANTSRESIEEYENKLSDIKDKIHFIESSPDYSTLFTEIDNLELTAERLGEEIAKLRSRAEKLALAICENLDAVRLADNERDPGPLLQQAKAMLKQLEDISLEIEKKWSRLQTIYLVVKDKVARWGDLAKLNDEVREALRSLDMFDEGSNEELQKGFNELLNGKASLSDMVASEKDAQAILAEIEKYSAATQASLRGDYSLLVEKRERLQECLDKLQESLNQLESQLETTRKSASDLVKGSQAIDKHLMQRGLDGPKEKEEAILSLMDASEIFYEAGMERLKDGRLCYRLAKDISQRSQKVTVPDVYRLPVKEAKQRIEDKGLQASFIAGESAPEESLAYKVDYQDPKPGDRVEQGTVVRLVIFGPNAKTKWKVPDVAGMKIKEARARLHGEGFKAEFKIGNPAPTQAKEMRAYSQHPSGGSLIEGDKGTVAVTVYGKMKVAETEQVPVVVSSEEPPQAFYVACKSYTPKLPEVKEGEKLKDKVRGLTPQNAQFVNDGQVIFLYIKGDAAKSYPKQFFGSGKRISLTINITFKSAEQNQEFTLHGALLLEVENVFDSYRGLVRKYPPDKYAGAKQAGRDASETESLTLIVVDNPDGQFFGDVKQKDAVIKFHGKGFTVGWPEEMKQKNIDLVRKDLEDKNLQNWFDRLFTSVEWLVGPSLEQQEAKEQMFIDFKK